MADIGSTLREARMRAKIDISEVEAETKIRAKYLRALENEEWSLLPGSTFVKSFLRTYADYLGLDSRLLLEDYKARFEPVSTAELQPYKPQLGSRRERPAPRGPGRGTVVAFVVALLVAALFALGKLFPSDSGDAGNAGQPRGTQTTTTTRTKTTTTQRSAAAPSRSRRRVRLEVLATGSVWVCLLDARGRKLIGGRTVLPGEHLPTFNSRRFTVNFGNGRAEMKVNGKTLPVADTGGPVGYSVTPRGRTVLAADKRPSCA
jgi:cytoskeleton protein RodZ